MLEALRSADTELTALLDESIHVPSGMLMEQLQEAIEILESEYANVSET